MRLMMSVVALLVTGSVSAQPVPQWGVETKKAAPAGTQTGTRPPPPPRSNSGPPPGPPPGQATGAVVPPPRPPGQSFRAYDPLDMWVNFRTFPIGWDFGKVGVGGKDKEITVGEESVIFVHFFGPEPKHELPKGPYTAGIIIETQGTPFDGIIQITENHNRVDDPVIKECPVTAGSVTCYGYSLLSPSPNASFRIKFKRREGSRASYNNPVIRKVIVDVPL